MYIQYLTSMSTVNVDDHSLSPAVLVPWLLYRKILVIAILPHGIEWAGCADSMLAHNTLVSAAFFHSCLATPMVWSLFSVQCSPASLCFPGYWLLRECL